MTDRQIVLFEQFLIPLRRLENKQYEIVKTRRTGANAQHVVVFVCATLKNYPLA